MSSPQMVMIANSAVDGMTTPPVVSVITVLLGITPLLGRRCESVTLMGTTRPLYTQFIGVYLPSWSVLVASPGPTPWSICSCDFSDNAALLSVRLCQRECHLK